MAKVCNGSKRETAFYIRLETAYEHQTKNAIYLGLCYRIRIDRRTPRGIKFWIGHENVFLVYGFIPTFSDSSSPAKCTFFCLAILVFSVVSSPKYRALDIRSNRISLANGQTLTPPIRGQLSSGRPILETLKIPTECLR